MTENRDRYALVTNATGFAGPPAVAALLDAGFHVSAHDEAFADDQVWRAFADGRQHIEPIADQAPEAIVDQAYRRTTTLHAIVSNDHYPAPNQPPDTAPVDSLRDNYSRLVEFPFRLIQAALPRLRQQSGANVVLITSNRTRLPVSGGAFPDAARAGANAMVRSLAIDCASDTSG